MSCVKTISLHPTVLRTIAVRRGVRFITVNHHGLRTIIVFPRTISLRTINFADSFLSRVRVVVTPVCHGVARVVAVRPVFVRPVFVRRVAFVRPVSFVERVCV
ncbi:MAG: hypothetical protein C0P62_001980 [Bacillota bacterium]|nr:hypothetical protein [Bacillota bacterium]